MSEEEQGFPPGASQAARLAGEHAGHEARGLIAELETAGVGDEDFDADLYWLLDRPRAERAYWNAALGMPRALPEGFRPVGLGRIGIISSAPKFTRSVDAALVLVGRMGWRLYSADLSIEGRASCFLKGPDRLWPATEDSEAIVAPGWERGVAKTLPLALCIACLKAFMTNVSDAQSDHAAQVSPAIRDEPLNPQSPLHQDQGQ